MELIQMTSTTKSAQASSGCTTGWLKGQLIRLNIVPGLQRLGLPCPRAHLHYLHGEDAASPFPFLPSILTIHRIGEKFIEWSDETPNYDEILDDVTLYWFTETFPRCIYPYRQVRRTPPGDCVVELHQLTIAFVQIDQGVNELPHSNPKYYCKKPVGYSWFPREIGPMPKAWVKTQGNLVWHRQHNEVGNPCPHPPQFALEYRYRHLGLLLTEREIFRAVISRRWRSQTSWSRTWKNLCSRFGL
jgi:hypothetical protein